MLDDDIRFSCIERHERLCILQSNQWMVFAMGMGGCILVISFCVIKIQIMQQTGTSRRNSIQPEKLADGIIIIGNIQTMLKSCCHGVDKASVPEPDCFPTGPKRSDNKPTASIPFWNQWHAAFGHLLSYVQCNRFCLLCQAEFERDIVESEEFFWKKTKTPREWLWMSL